MRYLLLLILVVFSSCARESNGKKFVNEIVPDYELKIYKEEIFSEVLDKKADLLLYRFEMDTLEFVKILSNENMIPNCVNYGGYSYENMKENAYPFSISDVDWWKPIYFDVPDFVGHFSSVESKFTSCFESREYKYAMLYESGYCYLIIENNMGIGFYE